MSDELLLLQCGQRKRRNLSYCVLTLAPHNSADILLDETLRVLPHNSANVLLNQTLRVFLHDDADVLLDKSLGIFHFVV